MTEKIVSPIEWTNERHNDILWFLKKKNNIVSAKPWNKNKWIFIKKNKWSHDSLIISFLLDKLKKSEEHILNKMQGTSNKG